MQHDSSLANTPNTHQSQTESGPFSHLPLHPYLLRHRETRLFLQSFTESGSTWVAKPRDAKVFFSRRRAEQAAEILNATVEDLPPVQPAVQPATPVQPAEPRSLSPLETLATVACEAAGCKFQGVQRAHGDHPPLILFAPTGVPKEFQTTLALSLYEFSTEAARRHVREALAKFGVEVAA